MNKGAQRIKGYQPEEIIGRNFSTCYTEEDLATHKPEHELAIVRDRGSVEDEGWRARKDGTRFWANVVITAVHDSRGKLRGFAKVTRDITERKKTEEMRKRACRRRRNGAAPRIRRVHGGLGLGLSIVRYIAEAHGGRVTALSEGRGKGSTFTVSLPIRANGEDPAAVSNALGEAFRYGNRLRDLQVVVADDDQASRKIVSAVLSAAGASVTVFESAAAALDAIGESRPDIIITDIAMPEVDGYAFARTLRERDRERASSRRSSRCRHFRGRWKRRARSTPKPIDPYHLVNEIARAVPRAPA